MSEIVRYRKSGRGVNVNSVFLDRRQGMAQLGLSFDGARDIYASAGYDKDIDHKKYILRYLRQGVAKRIVNIIADESWRLDPEVLDGLDPETAKDGTEFVNSWNYLANGGQIEEGETQAGLLHYLHRLDRVAGIGRYGVLLLGLDDGKDLSEPAKAESLKRAGVSGLLYVSVYDEGSATIIEYEDDPRSPRFGRPVYYSISTAAGNNTKNYKVHWSRVIHVADGALTDDYVGTPRLEAAWNDLLNLEKVMAALGETAYRLLIPILFLSTKDGYELPKADPRMSPEKRQEVEDAIASRTDELDDIVHGGRRTMELDGMEPKLIEGTLQDPTGAVQNIIDLISAATGIPQRLLLGSERGNLASEQDEANWAKVVESRQGKVVTSSIIRPVVNRLIWLGILPPPKSGTFLVKHKPLLQSKQTEVATVASTMADALTKIKAKVDVKEFVRLFIPDLPITAVEEAPEPVAQLPNQFGNQPGDQPGNQPGDQGSQGNQGNQKGDGIAVNAAFFTDVMSDSDGYSYP